MTVNTNNIFTHIYNSAVPKVAKLCAGPKIVDLVPPLRQVPRAAAAPRAAGPKNCGAQTPSLAKPPQTENPRIRAPGFFPGFSAFGEEVWRAAAQDPEPARSAVSSPYQRLIKWLPKKKWSFFQFLR